MIDIVDARIVSKEFGPWKIIIAENQSVVSKVGTPSLNTMQPAVSKIAVGPNQP